MLRDMRIYDARGRQKLQLLSSLPLFLVYCTFLGRQTHSHAFHASWKSPFSAPWSIDFVHGHWSKLGPPVISDLCENVRAHCKQGCFVL